MSTTFTPAGEPKKYRTGITREQIVDSAVDLTRRHGLAGWSVRDLVAELGTSISVIYRKAGGKDALSELVVGWIFENGHPDPHPTAGADPLDGLRALLMRAREILKPYPGTAKWIILHGMPGNAGSADYRVIADELADLGIVENRAGLFSAVFVTALSVLAMAEERDRHEDDGPRDHEQVLERMRRTGRVDEDMLAFAEGFTGGAERLESARRAHYEVVVDLLLAGLAARLPATHRP